VFDIALGDLKALALEVAGDLAYGQVSKLRWTQPVQVFLDALAFGHPGALATRPTGQTGLAVL